MSVKKADKGNRPTSNSPSTAIQGAYLPSNKRVNSQHRKVWKPSPEEEKAHFEELRREQERDEYENSKYREFVHTQGEGVSSKHKESRAGIRTQYQTRQYIDSCREIDKRAGKKGRVVLCRDGGMDARKGCRRFVPSQLWRGD